jgi:hypothetical protein
MSKDFEQVARAPKKFKLGHLGTLNQVIWKDNPSNG